MGVSDLILLTFLRAERLLLHHILDHLGVLVHETRWTAGFMVPFRDTRQ